MLSRKPTPLESAPTEAVAASAQEPRASSWRFALVVAFLISPIAWTFGVRYPGLDALEMFRNAGWGICPVLACYLAGAIVIGLGRSGVWLALATGVAGTFGSFVGVAHTIHALQLPRVNQVELLHAGKYEAHVCRFVGFAFVAGLVFAELARSPIPADRRGALRSALALLLGCLAAGVSVLTHASACVDSSWLNTHTRAERAATIVAASRDYDRTWLALAIALGAITALAALVVRARPGSLALPRASLPLGAALVLWSVFEGYTSFIADQASHSLYAAIAPELELMARLDPPTEVHPLDPPVLAPTLKIGQDKIAIDASPVGLTSALDSGSLDEVLFADLSHKLAQRADESPVRLLLMADRTTPVARLRAALRTVKRAGVDRVGMLYTRGPAPVFHPGDPPEAAYALPGDFGMEIIDLVPCGASSDAPLVLCIEPR